MPRTPTVTYETLESAAAVLTANDYGLRVLLDELDVATYVTDPDGLLVYANPACVAFAGRTPQPGVDRWCVTWKLYRHSGEFLPHDECPMAVAIREKKPVRGVVAIAERPDGSRVAFSPSPTPIFGRDNRLLGAVNMLAPLAIAA
jgi:PAS domain-containing protein